MVTHVAPPGWPREVRPPDAPDWERTAVNWLLDLCPPEYRGYPALRRHVVVLARFTVLHVEACQAAVKRGLSEARAELRDVATLDVPVVSGPPAPDPTWGGKIAQALEVAPKAGTVTGVVAKDGKAIKLALVGPAALLERKEAWADAYRHTPHGKPIELGAHRAHDHAGER